MRVDLMYNGRMRDWTLKEGDPLSLVLAADARLCKPDYVDDQIWELKLREGEPAALSLYTTFGLRARNMRIFLRFSEGDQTAIDPDRFESPPAIHRFFPNYLLITFSPFYGINVVHELWVPESHVIAGRIRTINSGVTPRSVNMDLVSLLTPSGEGERMTPVKIQGVTAMKGQTSGLTPTIFLTGGPGSSISPYPCLTHELELLPGLERSFVWAQACLRDGEASFNLAREMASRKWDAEVARIELTNSSQVVLETGDPDWDATFAMGQKVALGLVHGPTEHLPHPSFVLNRGPDQGYSLRGDGSDYNYLWNGQTALDTWYLASMILPSAPSIVTGLLNNFLSIQQTLGYADWKPGLGGKRTRMDATPLLATLAWEIYQQSGDLDSLAQAFPELLTFVLSWFSPYHDQDEDGIPEWDTLMQAGFDDHPVFTHWHPWSQGVDISTNESPALCAFLYRECRSLMNISRALGRAEPLGPLSALAEDLRAAVESSWDGGAGMYRYWDRDTHQSPHGKPILDVVGPSVKRLRRRFDPPARLQLRLMVDADTSRAVQITLIGEDSQGETLSETVSTDGFRWHLERGSWTSDQTYASLKRLEVHDLHPKATLSLQTVDFQHIDHSLMLPLWARIPSPDRARDLIDGVALNPERFGKAFGISIVDETPVESANDLYHIISLPWNTLIAEGMLAYGNRAEAATLLSRMMEAIVENLRRESSFRSSYRADTGQGVGDRNALAGLPPLGLFLKILGVRLISPWEVGLEGSNPFPWPVKVQYQGVTIFREGNETTISFPDGQEVRISDPAPCIVRGRG
jgi:hypothetical protein